MLQQDKPDDYVIATNETHKVREFVEKTFNEIGITIEWQGSGVDEKGVCSKTGNTLVEVDQRYCRPIEVYVLIGDYSKAKRELGWEPKVRFRELVRMMAQYGYHQLKNRQ